MRLKSAEFYNNEFLKIRNELSTAINKCFGNLSKYAYFSGTFAYGGAKKKKSDIDITIVFKNAVYLLKKDKFINNLKEFIKKYENIHKKYNYCLDKVFSGEYVTVSQIEDAIKGRGFSVNKKGHLYLPLASNRYYLKNREHWFRAWLSSIAFSVPVNKGPGLSVSNKINAWQTIILFILATTKTDNLDANSILVFLLNNSNKWAGMGITKHYIFFKEMETKVVEKALKSLQSKGFLVVRNGMYKKVKNKLYEWEKEISKSILSGKVKRSPFLFDREDIKLLQKQSG